MQKNVIEYFEKGALSNCRQKVAIIDHEQKYSFEEIERFSKNCASKLMQRTKSINCPVAVFLSKTVLTIIADLGILYSGNCFANLDSKSPPERLLIILENLGASVIITSASEVAKLQALGIPEEKLFLIEQAVQQDADYDNAVLFEQINRIIDTDPLCIIHTSGSTGIPKGVALNHRGTIDFMDWVFETFDTSGSKIIGSLSPFYFDIYLLELFLCLCKGSTLVIIPEQYAAFPAKLVDFMEAQAISFIFWVPTIMVNMANQNLLSTKKIGCLKTIFFAGEVFPTRHLNYWRRHLPGALFVNLYGPIEIHVDCLYFIVDREFADDESLPIGFPCRNSDILVLNAQDQPAADNEPGELCVRGSSLTHGYWNNPERTAAAFTQNPLNTAYPELIYRTGDLVYRKSNGEFIFIGRKDFQIKHLGYRIELGEIETAVLSISEIANACVLYNQGKKEITLFYEAKEELKPAIIRQQLTNKLPKYMLPTVFHWLDNMPQNQNGKIDRQKLTKSLMDSN